MNNPDLGKAISKLTKWALLVINLTRHQNFYWTKILTRANLLSQDDSHHVYGKGDNTDVHSIARSQRLICSFAPEIAKMLIDIAIRI